MTEEGKEFYSYISQAIEYISNAETKFTELINLETGYIKIGISTTLTKEFLLPYLEKFHSLYPNVHIQIITNISSELFSKLRFGLIDLIILNLNDTFYGNDIDIIKCRKISDCFVANKMYSNLLGENISIKELNKLPLILQLKGSNTRDFLDGFTKNYGVILNPQIELASYSLVVEFAKIGMGIGYVTRDYVKKELNSGELFELNLNEKIPDRYIGIATSKKNMPNFSAKKLIEMIRIDGVNK